MFYRVSCFGVAVVDVIGEVGSGAKVESILSLPRTEATGLSPAGCRDHLL
jgi:hypothetical protein